MFEPLDPALVLGAYSVGVFPMADSRDARSVYWVEPRRRAILPLDGFHLARSLRKVVVADRFRVTADRAFKQVLQLCAESAADRPETWINRSIEDAFTKLHAMGHAHSVECWIGDELVGGLYGLAIGRAFFGESMVSRVTDASKVAIAALVARLRAGGYMLLDCQFMTQHLATLGAVEVSRGDYMALLASALGGSGDASESVAGDGDFGAIDRLAVAAGDDVDVGAGPVPGKLIAQLLIQTS
ncbi:leucyl/phenylalanyl-tRNA--protein transferase [Sphingomonas sp. Mn802worker]|uniref:leucyl/phenylalanyl-tRNA--protein transferase n=1 Tax=Sphingomonas sp. Mn802worker TaxID=629773 RepID=UPI0003700E20|nr:leucyl/phenylalanyl-tRNA--protein transferase [Sphingomonas sp. Mn802worker]